MGYYEDLGLREAESMGDDIGRTLAKYATKSDADA